MTKINVNRYGDAKYNFGFWQGAGCSLAIVYLSQQYKPETFIEYLPLVASVAVLSAIIKVFVGSMIDDIYIPSF